MLLGFFLHDIAEYVDPPSKDLRAFLWPCFWVSIASGCFLTLTWITFIAGLDLWKLRDRGRKLAYISMIPFLIVGVGFLLSSYNRWRVAGVVLCLFAGFFLIYLQRPFITKIFAAQPNSSH